MNLFKRPLIALSLSDSDVGLLQYAAMLAGVSDFEQIRFAHVVHESKTRGSQESDQALRDRLESLVNAHFGVARAPMAYDVVHGARLDQLLALVVKNKNDVVVLGHRRERTGNRGLARRLAMVAPSSIWLVPEGAPARLNRILVPVDFSSYSADALSMATAIAAARGLKTCQALHVFFDPSTVRYDEHVQEIVGQERAAFDHLLKDVNVHGVEVERIFEESTHPVQAILRVAQRQETDLIVMNTRGRSKSAAVLLGSITSRTMASSALPVLAVKHFGSRMTMMQALLHHRFWEDPSPKSN